MLILNHTLWTRALSLFLGAALLVSAPIAAQGFGGRPITPAPSPAPTPKPTAPPTPAPTPAPTPSQEPDVIRARWEQSQRDGVAWSKHVYQQLPVLGADLLAKNPKDVAAFCANYENLNLADRKNVWVYFLSAMAELESGHKPETTFTEAFNDAKGNKVISRGLLQLSIESGNGYGCALKNAEELQDPLVNLNCGLRILNRWVGRDGVISDKEENSWRGGARYWAVLRQEKHLVKIKGWVQSQRLCAK
jgi:hypothetical protein